MQNKSVALLFMPIVVFGLMFGIDLVRGATLNPLEDWEHLQPRNAELVNFLDGESVTGSGETIAFEIQAHCTVIQLDHLGKTADGNWNVTGGASTCVEGPSGQSKCVYETDQRWDTDEVLYSQVWADECWDLEGNYRGRVVTPMTRVQK